MAMELLCLLLKKGRQVAVKWQPHSNSNNVHNGSSEGQPKTEEDEAGCTQRRGRWSWWCVTEVRWCWTFASLEGEGTQQRTARRWRSGDALLLDEEDSSTTTTATTSAQQQWKTATAKVGRSRGRRKAAAIKMAKTRQNSKETAARAKKRGRRSYYSHLVLVLLRWRRLVYRSKGSTAATVTGWRRRSRNGEPNEEKDRWWCCCVFCRSRWRMRRDVMMMKWLVSTEAEKKMRGVGGAEWSFQEKWKMSWLKGDDGDTWERQETA